ncbi:hypothetical protein ABT052_32605 [Streptomyces sp. NPDC002766]|uniref:hypothetical protein n=1 Tax=unclassified Streptomyces TaxID=2593676 RepID=UPI0033182C23
MDDVTMSSPLAFVAGLLQVSGDLVGPAVPLQSPVAVGSADAVGDVALQRLCLVPDGPSDAHGRLLPVW